MASWEFPVTDPIDLDISLISGSIAVTAEPADVITVSLLPNQDGQSGEEDVASVAVEYSGWRLTIAEPKHVGLRRHGASLRLAVKVPAGSRCAVRTAACDVTCEGELGSLDVRTASGDIAAAAVTGPVQMQTASGDIRLDDAAAEVRAHSGTGSIRLQRAGGDIAMHTAGGDIEIGTAAASVNARTATGSIQITSLTAGHADLTSVSGHIAVGIVPGIGVYLDLASVTGQVSTELDRSDTEGYVDLRLRCRTTSGDLRVTRAVLAGDAS